MEMVFGYEDIWALLKFKVDPLGENSTEAQRVAHKEVKKKDYKELFITHQCLNPIFFERVDDILSSKEARDILEKAYANMNNVKKARLRTHKRRYELLQKKWETNS